MNIQYVVTLAVPLCGLFDPCAPRDVAPLVPKRLHFGDCLGLQHLPIGPTSELRQEQLPGGGRVTWPCGGKAR